jgi:threonine dehydratase
VRTIVTPLSGGGLFGGIALAAKSLNPRVRMIAVSAERCAAMYDSICAGHPIKVIEHPSIADSICGGIGLDNRYTFPLARDLADEHVVLTDEAIIEGIRWGFWQEGLVLEGGAAASIAACLTPNASFAFPLVLVVTGDNIDRQIFGKLVSNPPKHSH